LAGDDVAPPEAAGAEFPEFLYVDEDGNFTDAEGGNPVDLEALLAEHPEAKPPAEWTDDEVMAWGEQRFAWNTAPLDHAWVSQVTEAMVAAWPEGADEIKQTTAFVVEHHARSQLPKVWAAPLDLRQRAIESAGRQHPRERQERRSVDASAGGGDPSPKRR
jgi:hypothetical protein